VMKRIRLSLTRCIRAEARKCTLCA